MSTTQYFEQLTTEQQARVMAAIPRFKKGYKLVRRENALTGDVLFIAAVMRKDAKQNADEMQQKEIKNKTKPHYHFTDVTGKDSTDIWANAKEMYALEIYEKENTKERSLAPLPDHIEKAPVMDAEELAAFKEWQAMQAEKAKKAAETPKPPKMSKTPKEPKATKEPKTSTEVEPEKPIG